MLTPPLAAIQEIHKLHSSGSILYLIAVPQYGDYLARSRCDIAWNGTTYQRSWFEIEGVAEDSDSQSPQVLVHFSNVGGFVEERVLANGNYSRAWVDLYVVNSNCLDETEPIYHVRLQVQKVTPTRKQVTFQLGLTNPLLLTFPAWKFHDSICQYKPYNLDLCPKVAVCAQTLTACLAWGNDVSGHPYTERFGAQLGLMGAIQTDTGL